MASLEELLAASQAQSQGAGSVPSSAPSPLGTAPAGTPGSQPSGVSSPTEFAPLGEQPTTPMASPMPAQAPAVSLESILSQSQQESQKPPSETEQGQSALQNLGGGMNGWIADAVHSAYWAGKSIDPVANIKAAARGQRLPIQDLLNSDAQRPEMQKFKAYLHEATGMSFGAEKDSTMGHIGQNMGPAMLTLGAFYAAAPIMAAAEGLGVSAYIQRTFGKALLEHPWLAITSDLVGGVPGSTIGEEQYGAVGALVGGVAGNVATAPLQATGRGLIKAGRALAAKAVDAADTIGKGMGGQGLRSTTPTVPDDIVDTYRSAEARTRSIGEGVVEAGSEYREARKVGNPQAIFDAKHKLWALKQDEATAADEAEAAFMKIPEAVRGKYSREATAIRSTFDNPAEFPKQFAEEQIAGEKKVVEDKIMSALRDVGPTNDKLTSADYSARIAKGIVESERIASKVESRYWDRVPLQERMPSRAAPASDLDLYMAEMKEKFSDSQIPYDNVKSFYKLFAPQSEQGIFQRNPTLQKVRAEITALREARNQEMAKDAPQATLIANMHKLEALGHKWIGEAFPDNIPLQQARAFSTWKNDVFSRSELFPFLHQGARGQDKVRPEDALIKLMSRPNGLDDLYAATNQLLNAKRIPKQPDAYPSPLSNKQKDTVQQLQKDTSDGIRQMFKEEVEKHLAEPLNNSDPTKAALQTQRIVSKWEPRIQSFSKAASEMQTSMTEALKGVSDRRAIEHSALVKYFETNDATKAIDKVWASSNPTQVAKALISGEAGIGGFAKDPVALEGFRSALVDKLFKAAGRNGIPDPHSTQQVLSDPRVNSLLSAVLGHDRMSRLERVVSTSIALEKDASTSNWRYGVSWFAQMAALKVAAFVPHFGSGGQLKQAALFSEMAKRKVMQVMAGGDPVTLMTEAVRNPTMERLMFSKLPEVMDKQAMKEGNLLVRRVLRMEVGLRGSIESVLGQEDGPGPKKRFPDLSNVGFVSSAMAADRPPLDNVSHTDATRAYPPPASRSVPVHDPFGNRVQGKDQGRVTPGNPPAWSGKQSEAPRSWQEASVGNGHVPTSAEDYNTSAKIIANDSRKDRIQAPLRRKTNPFSPGAPIDPGQHRVPTNRGLDDRPWNTLI